MTLRLLDLGVEMAIVKSYLAFEPNDTRNRTQLTKRLRDAITVGLAGLGIPECLPNVQRLKFRGLDLGALTDGPNSPLVNWAALTHLTLESCCALNASLPIMGQLQFRSLQYLQIRSETRDYTSWPLLETFLRALPPLKSLFLLLEGESRWTDLGPILRTHGESLRAFILDFRLGPRLTLSCSRSICPMDDTIQIFKYCPNLVELGMPLHWEHIQKHSHRRKVSLVKALPHTSNKAHSIYSSARTWKDFFQSSVPSTSATCLAHAILSNLCRLVHWSREWLCISLKG